MAITQLTTHYIKEKHEKKFNIWFFSFFIVVLVFNLPYLTLAQQNPIEAEAKVKAVADAESDVNRTSWFMAGCFMNIIGVLIARTNITPVPAERFVGKSPEYIAIYTLNYQTERSKILTKSAVQGCATGTLALMVVLAIAGSDSDSCGPTIDLGDFFDGQGGSCSDSSSDSCSDSGSSGSCN